MASSAAYVSWSRSLASQTRRGCQAGSPLGIPNHVNGRDDVAVVNDTPPQSGSFHGYIPELIRRKQATEPPLNFIQFF